MGGALADASSAEERQKVRANAGCSTTLVRRCSERGGSAARVGHIDRLTEASFISLNPDEPGLGEHLDAGRRAMLADSGALWLA